MRRFRVASALFFAVFLLASSCNKRSEGPAETATAPVASATTAPSDAPAAAAPSTAAPVAPVPPAAVTVIASGTYSEDPNLRCDLLEVRRITGGALLARWRIVNATPVAAGGLTTQEAKPIHYDFGWGDLYYVDPAENKKYGYLTDSEGNRILDVWWGYLKPGEQRTNWAKFPAPPPTSNKISITLPKFAPFEDVPVAQ